MPHELSDAQLSRLSSFIADAMGLHFPPERRTDLQRGIADAAHEFGFNTSADCVDWLLATALTKAELDVLASHLTVGETYFFRDRRMFDVLAEQVLPALIRARMNGEKRLRIWSAGCCTGEEAYSLAILLCGLIPNLDDWRVTILATDINPRFLRKAAAGIYGDWSFRDAPTGLRERYFQPVINQRYQVLSKIRQMVTFSHLNLAKDVYPSLATDTNAMDLILCRNVLMYFTPEQTKKCIGYLHRCLVDGGWLAVSPSEASHALFGEFVTRNYPGVILYERNEHDARMRPTLSPVNNRAGFFHTQLEHEPVHVPASPQMGTPAHRVPEERTTSPLEQAEALYAQGRYAEVEDILVAVAGRNKAEPRIFSLLTRTLANQGKLAEALHGCDRWIAADKLDPAAHYLRAVVLMEQGELEQAGRSLQRTIYLKPDFALAHFALGNLARNSGKQHEADRHFSNTLKLLGRYRADEPLPQSEGLTAGRLTETIANLTAVALAS